MSLMDSTAHTSHKDSEIMNELLSRVTHGFDSPSSRRDSEIINELLSRVTHGFDSKNSP
jgi:hypothetical protein